MKKFSIPIDFLIARFSWRAFGGRRLIAVAALLAICTFGALATLRPSPPKTVDALIAATDLSIGSTLARGDVKLVRIPPHLLPANAQTRADQVVGEVVGASVPAGVVLTAHAFDTAQRYGETPPGTVAAPVRLPDAHAVQILNPGDRIDVFVSRPAAPEFTAAEVVVRSALVLEIPQADDSGGGILGSGVSESSMNIVVLAVTEDQAAKLAGAGQYGALSIALVQ